MLIEGRGGSAVSGNAGIAALERPVEPGRGAEILSTKSLSRLTLPAEGLAFDPTTGDSFVINDCGARILRAFQMGCREEEVVRMLHEEYEISEEDAERDVADFHGRLRTLQLA